VKGLQHFLSLSDLEEAARRTARSSFSSNFQRSSLISLVLSPHFPPKYSRKVSWEEPSVLLGGAPVDGSVIGYSWERQWYASAFGSEPQWAEVAETAH
jgi:hypothetical protein